MNLAVSNLGWEHNNLEKIISILAKNKIQFIEGVLTKIDEWDNLSLSKIKAFKSTLSKQNIKVESLQAIFYKSKCSSINENQKILNHLAKIMEFSQELGVSTLVFGSPSLRKDNQSKGYLKNLFYDIDLLSQSANLNFVIEPNSRIYGGDFFYTVDEIVEFLTINNYTNIKTMIDTHNSFLENKDPSKELTQHFEFINHIHISEKNLTPLKNYNNHLRFSKNIKKTKYQNLITLEVLDLINPEQNIKIFHDLYN